MEEIEISELGQNINAVLQAVAQGQEVILTRATEPVAKVAPLAAPKKRRQAGSAQGQIWMAPDFDEPLDEFREYME